MLRLEYFTREDFPQLIEWINNETLLTNWAGSMFRFPLNNDSLEWYIEDTNNLPVSEAYIYKAVNEDGRTVGHISLGGISEKNRSARISRVFVDPACTGKGYCRQMMKAVLEVAFGDLQLHRVSLGAYDDNKAAIKCYQASGFVIEGVYRDVLFYNNKFHSLVEMAILEDEWRAGLPG